MGKVTSQLGTCRQRLIDRRLIRADGYGKVRFGLPHLSRFAVELPKADATLGEDEWKIRYEPVKWRVLSASGGAAFVVSDKALDFQRYNVNAATVTWETSSVRSWLNGYASSSNESLIDYSRKNFIDGAFSTAEKGAVLLSDVINDDNSKYGTDGGNDTADRVFLLSESDLVNASYGFAPSNIEQDEGRQCKATDYARALGSDSSASWSLRSLGYNDDWNAFVTGKGVVNRSGYLVSDDTYWTGGVRLSLGSIRPAMRINPSSSEVFWAGTVSSDGTMNEVPSIRATIPITSLRLPTLDEKFSAYTGKAKTISGLTVMAGDLKVPSYGYTVSYKNNVNAGTATVTVTGTGDYSGSASATFTISKVANPITVTVGLDKVPLTYNPSASPGSSKNVTPVAAKGAVTFANASTDATAKKFPINKSNGMVTVPKATAAGTYVVKVRVQAAGDGNYLAGSKTASYKIVVGKAANPLSVKLVKAPVAVTYKPSKATVTKRNVTVSGARGTVSYTNVSTNATAKKFTVNKTSGKVTVPKGTKAGAYTVRVKVAAAGNANYKAGSKNASYKIVVERAANPMVVKAISRAVTRVTVMDSAFTVAAPVDVSKAKGKISYARVAKGSSKALSVDKSTGKVTIKKGTKAGDYTIKLKVTAAGNANYEAKSVTIACTVAVK